MKRVCRGIVEGKIIRLRESIDLPKGTEAMVSLRFFEKETEKEILARELSFLELLRRG